MSNRQPVSFLRWLRLSPTKSALILTFFLATFWYYSLILPAHPSGYERHALQRDLVSRNLWTGDGAILPSSDAVKEVCRQHGYSAYPQNNGTQRRVYDVFPFMLELDWLEIRLRTLSPFVDYFVIVEFSTTFTGLPWKPILEANMDRFKEFKDRMLRFVVDDEVESDWVWDHEIFMKNQMLYQTFPSFIGTEREAKEGDVIMVSDVDEIPKPETVTLLRHCEFPERLTLRSHFYYYSYQWLHRGEQWHHPQATTYHGIEGTISPQDLRRGEGGTGFSLFHPIQRWMKGGNLWDAAWHCSSCFKTIKQVQDKMGAFSHIEYNTPENRKPKAIAERFRNGLDLFGRGGQLYDRVEDNKDVPKYVLNNAERFKYLIDRDGEDAAFVDYYEAI